MTGVAPTITARELDVLRLLAAGLQNKQIANRLRLSKKTIETHRWNLRRKSGCKNAFQLGVWAVRRGIVGAEA